MRFTHHLTHPQRDPAGRGDSVSRLGIAMVLVVGLALAAIALDPLGLHRFLLPALSTGFVRFRLATVLGLCALVFALPLRYVPLLFGWVAMPLILGVVRYEVVPHFHEGNNAPFDFAFTILGWLGLMAIMAGLWMIRVVAASLRSRSGANAAATYARKFRWLLPVHGWILGGFLALLLQFWIMQAAQGVRPAWLPHAGILAASCGIWAVARVLGILGRWLASVRALMRGLACGMLICLGVEIGFSLVVLGEAQRIAGKRPYCLQSADRIGEYQPVRSRLDLSALTMQARVDHGLYQQHHAVLVVQGSAANAIFHWSYNRRTFVSQDGAPDPVIYCSPELGFSARLPWIETAPPSSAATVQISLAGRTYRIPPAYKPRISGARQDIRIAAMAPDFTPLADPPEKGMDVLRLAHLSFAPDSERRFLLRDAARTLYAGAEYGLIKRTFYEAGMSMLRYQDAAPDAGNDNLIECQHERCIFLFIRDGVGYEFESDPTAVPRWKELSDRLVALFDSWRVP